MHAMPRRTFLQRTAALVGGALAVNAAPAAGQGCRPTETDIIGPFYRFGAPFQTRLAGPNEPGDRLVNLGVWDSRVLASSGDAAAAAGTVAPPNVHPHRRG